MAVDLTGRSNRYVREHPSTALFNVRPDRLSSWIPRYYPGELLDVHLVFVDDVPVFVDFQHGFEFGVHGDVHGVRQRLGEMYLDKQVVLLYQMEAGSVTRIGGQVETEEGVAGME